MPGAGGSFDRHPDQPWGRAGTYGALDLGTNNCRLLVARPTRAGFQVVDAFSRIVRLGEGVQETGVLSGAAMDRAMDALEICADKLKRRGVGRVRAVATHACRQASNSRDFASRVFDRTGLMLETIQPSEEAMLAVRGCVPLLNRDIPHALVFDIGGGSTQLAWLHVRQNGIETLGVASIPIGVMTLGERMGLGPQSADGFNAVVAEVDRAMAGFCDDNGIAAAVARGEVQLIGASGTVTTLTGIELELPRYNRAAVDGSYLSLASVERLAEELRGQTLEERASYPCVGRERADLLIAGCAILEAIRRRWPVARLRVADRGIREGILIELMREDGYVTAREEGSHGL